MKIRTVVLAVAAALATMSGQAIAQHEGHHTPSDSGAVAEVVAKYHAALSKGDSAAALALLADDAVILETGGVETRDEYRAHHLSADINFAKAVPSQYGPVHVRIHHDMAWTTSTFTTQGEMNGRAINSRTAEMMVLTRTPAGWKISAIHWSSARRS